MKATTQFGVWQRVLVIVLLTACTGGGDNEANGSAVEAPITEQPKLMPYPTPIRYPRNLWDENVEGETEVLVRVNEVGDVVHASVAQSSGHEEFDTAAVNGARRLRFTPAKRGDTPVATHVRIPVRFARDSSATVGAPRPAGNRNE